MKNANINVRIEENLYAQVKNADINISEIVRAALVSELEKNRVTTIMKELESASRAVKKMGMKSIIKSIREDRDSR